MEHSTGSEFVNRLAQIKKLDHNARYGLIEPLFYDLLESVSNDEKILFNTAFSRVAYVGTKYSLSSGVLYGLHTLRKKIRDQTAIEEEQWPVIFWSLGQLIEKVYTIRSVYEYSTRVAASIRVNRRSYEEFISRKKVSLQSLNEENNSGTIIPLDDPHNEIILSWDEADINENFSPNLRAIIKYDLLPIEIMLHNIRVGKNKVWYPQLFVFDPDFLIDVTSIAECFQPFGLFTESYILRKFLSQSESKPLLTGIIANFFLDQLLLNSDCSFEEIFPKTFSIKSLSLALLSDEEVLTLQADCKVHFINLKSVVQELLPQEGIDINKVMIEPSFYSSSYGLQGRLDVLSLSDNKGTNHIIELKSGKPFRPNAYGISSSHFIQTLLYNVIIKNLESVKSSPTCYILYSRLDEKPLRHAPFVFSKLTEALVARNILLIYERISATNKLDLILNSISQKRLSYLKGFSSHNVINFESQFASLTPLRKAYLLAFSTYLSIEQRYSKLGNELAESNGLSGLWKDSLSQKFRLYNIINHLIFDHLSYGDQVITLNRSDKTHPLSNFRVGDIVVIYAHEDGDRDALESHVLKGTLTEMSSVNLSVRLRSIPMDITSFERTEYWNIEHDLIDSQFNKMYRSLFQFVSNDNIVTDLYLGLKSPEAPENIQVELSGNHLSDEQNRIIKRIIRGKDYFLLWGPPGTGKTSVVLYTYIDYLVRQTEDRIIIMAYTNRAVDEICQSITKIKDCDFIRIGSRYSVAKAYRKNLLSSRMESIGTRAQTIELLKKTRIYVATVSSLLSVPQLFKLISFDRAVIDEASQLLEPQLVGILSHFKHTLMIGDHLQLPAVSQSNQVESTTENKNLNEIGIKRLDVSLFERLYKNAQNKNWNHAFDMLQYQGRMHDKLNYFPSKYFYKGKMKILMSDDILRGRLTREWNYSALSGSCFQNILLSKRCIFYDTADDLYDGTKKNNENEANRVVAILNDLNNSILTKENFNIGVITPYRAQIATINNYVEAAKINLADLTIDTVERYQGSARDIIIVSLCINHPRQLRMLTSMTDQGVDRKFNVMLTRAREQVIILGNKNILRRSKVYSQYIELYEQAWLTNDKIQRPDGVSNS